MRKIMLLAGSALLLLASPALAQGQGKGKSGGGHAAEHGGEKGKGGGKSARTARGPDRDSGRSADRPTRSASTERSRGPDRPAKARSGGGQDREQVRGDRPDREVRVARVDRGPDRVIGVAARGERPDRRVTLRVAEGGRYRWAPAFLTGCPPGLAKKGNGCLPPGQARKLASPWLLYSPWYIDTMGYDWRYANGYAYRVDPMTGLVAAFLPLLGGALYPGNVWPTTYTQYVVDPYYGSYYGLGRPYDYRYANGALFAVDPETQAIAAIAALLTGDPWVVGSPMPVGYSFYNVPPAYRTRYYDTPTALYRYSDGYVYRVEPRTMVVREAIILPV
jgi:hypothetical protein